VGHVGGQKKTLADSHVVVLAYCIEALRNALGNFNNHVAVCSLSRLWSYLLVIEKQNHVDFRVLANLGVKLVVTDDRVKSAQTAAKIVEARSWNELFVHTNELGGHWVTYI